MLLAEGFRCPAQLNMRSSGEEEYEEEEEEEEEDEEYESDEEEGEEEVSEGEVPAPAQIVVQGLSIVHITSAVSCIK